MNFTIEKNRHILACWGASRAAGVSPLCRFQVKKGKWILEQVFGESGPNDKDVFRNEQVDFNNYHDEKIKEIIKHSEKKNIQTKIDGKTESGMRYGVAAKLLNVYFKILFICGNYKNETGLDYIHPPIDSLLLNSIYKASKEKQKFWKYKWSKINYEQYYEIINGIKELTKEEGLWSIEKYWIGHQ